LGIGLEGTRKGIFFTIIAVLLLSFMLISVGLWSSVVNAREARVPEKIKTDSMAQIIFQLSEQKVNRFANISGYYALSRLANYSVGNPITPAGADGTGSINKSMYDLMIYGSTDGGGSWYNNNLTYSTALEQQYTFANWTGQLEKSADVMGFVFKMGNVTNYSFAQIDPWNVRVQFDTNISIKDKEATMMLKKTLHVNVTYSILGMPDPLFTRELFPLGNYSKIIFAAEDPAKRDQDQYIASVSAANAPRGNGWASGYATTDTNLSGHIDPTTDSKTYILVTDYPEKADGSPDDVAFAKMLDPRISGVIITHYKQNITYSYDAASGCNWSTITDMNGPTRYRVTVDANHNYADCPSPPVVRLYDANIPFISLTGGAPSLGDQAAIQNYPGANEIVPLVESSYHVIYDITGPRKLMECGLYAHPSGAVAPSFLQRMLSDATDRTSSQFGIESFLISQWAGGNSDHDNTITNYYSRWDIGYYNQTQGTRIKGGSGCKTKQMCAMGQAPDKMPLGQFRLDDSTAQRYNMYGLRCNMVTPTDSNVPSGGSCE